MSDFIKKLEYLFTLKAKSRSNNPDWVEMVRLLGQDGHWKGRPRGNAYKNKYSKGRLHIITADGRVI